MSENRNDSETEYALVEDPLNMHRTASNGATLVSKIPKIINEENVIIAPRKEKKLILVTNFVQRKHFLIFFLRVNLAIMLLEIFQ